MISPLGSRYGIQGALGRSVKRAAAGTWWDLNGTITSCIAAYQPKGAASLEASYVNLADSGTLDCLANSAPTQSATDGWIFTADALRNGLTSTSASAEFTVISRFTNMQETVAEDYLFGGVSATTGMGIDIRPRYTNNVIRYHHGASYVTGSTCPSSGVLAVSKDGGYLNGMIDSDPLAACDFGVHQLYNFAIGSRYWGKTEYASTRITCYIQAVAIYNATLTSTQIGNLTTAMNAL